MLCVCHVIGHVMVDDVLIFSALDVGMVLYWPEVVIIL